MHLSVLKGASRNYHRRDEAGIAEAKRLLAEGFYRSNAVRYIAYARLPSTM